MTENDYAKIEADLPATYGKPWRYVKQHKFVDDSFGAVVCDVANLDPDDMHRMGEFIANAPMHVAHLYRWARLLESRLSRDVIEELQAEYRMTT